MLKKHIVEMAAPDGSTWFDYKNEYDPVVDENPDLTIAVIANICDQNAELLNHHSFVGTHRILAALLNNIVGESDTHKIMFGIAEYGGLDGMNTSKVFDEFGISGGESGIVERLSMEE